MIGASAYNYIKYLYLLVGNNSRTAFCEGCSVINLSNNVLTFVIWLNTMDHQCIQISCMRGEFYMLIHRIFSVLITVFLP